MNDSQRAGAQHFPPSCHTFYRADPPEYRLCEDASTGDRLIIRPITREDTDLLSEPTLGEDSDAASTFSHFMFSVNPFRDSPKGFTPRNATQRLRSHHIGC
ncbi:hypothetical protein J6590_040474 [Homalodisca vitripennis]|nr:hypothetical protein J6590_040474 [Homalodisca vitripennis]